MVYLKVSDGSETHKLQVTPGEVSFDQLKQQLAAFFPQTLGDGSKGLSLQYRDADGDVITLSSDQELQEALSHLQEDGVWKVYVKSGQKTSPSSCQQRSQRRNGCGRSSLLHHLFEPRVVRPCGLFSDVWDDLEQSLKLLHTLHGEVFSSENKTDKSATASENQQKPTTGTASSSEAPATTASSTEQSATAQPDEEVKSKPQAAHSDKKEENAKSGGSSDASSNQWQTRRFVAWEPRVHVGPFGFFHSQLTPVVYNVSFRSSDDGCCSAASKGGEATTTEKQSQKQDNRAGPAEREEEKVGVPTPPSYEAATTTTQ